MHRSVNARAPACIPGRVCDGMESVIAMLMAQYVEMWNELAPLTERLQVHEKTAWMPGRLPA